jgi:hypothetical protein
MKLIPIELISEDMILGKPIFAKTGQILLSEGVALKSSYKDKLKKFGIREVYIINKEKSKNNP